MTACKGRGNLPCDECGGTHCEMCDLPMAEHSGEVSLCGPANGTQRDMHMVRCDHHEECGNEFCRHYHQHDVMAGSCGPDLCTETVVAGEDVMCVPLNGGPATGAAKAIDDREDWEVWPAPWSTHGGITKDAEGSEIMAGCVSFTHNAMASRLAEVERELADARTAIRDMLETGDWMADMLSPAGVGHEDGWAMDKAEHADAISKARDAEA